LERDKEPDEPIRTYKDGQIIKQVDVECDVETGQMTGGRVITWSYYPTGEVDEITIGQRDEMNAEISRKVIKHFTTGEQPTVRNE
jgi:hypothetical protein